MTRIKTLKSQVNSIDLTTAKPLAKTAEPFYSSKPWLALMARIKSIRGERCEDPRCRNRDKKMRVVGDHIVELKDGGDPLDERNVLLRCWPCHTRKSNEARAARMKRPASVQAPEAPMGVKSLGPLA